MSKFYVQWEAEDHRSGTKYGCKNWDDLLKEFDRVRNFEERRGELTAWADVYGVMTQAGFAFTPDWRNDIQFDPSEPACLDRCKCRIITTPTCTDPAPPPPSP